MEEIYGFVENIVFSGEGFTVAKLKEPRKTELTCIVGPMPMLQPGETLRCKGSWEHHPQHGRQFKVASFESHQPSDLFGIQKYLESGMIKGIGPIYAERIVKKFGLETLKVIDETPKRLREVEGIGAKRVILIESCWQQQKAIRDVMIFLRSHGISPAFAQKIYKAYGDASIEKVKSDPYLLAKEIHGIGFKIADGIAKGLGMPADCSARIDAGIEYVLWELSNDGHTCFPEKELVIEAAATLDVKAERIVQRIEALFAENQLHRENGYVWVKPLYVAETGIAKELKRLKYAPGFLRQVDIEKALFWVQAQLKIELAKDQKSAVAAAVKEKVHIITGGPGTGKSTITKAILRITEKLTDKIVLAAPTGRAAKRMSEITHKKASTIHMLLEMDFQSGGFKKNRENPLDCALIIVDEASMIDTLLMYNLLKAIPSTARVIFIGDIDQLPSVGPGNILRDMIDSEKIGVTRLTEIFRQAAGSRIVTNAHRINAGEFPDISTHPKSDFKFIEAETPEEILSTVVDLVTLQLPKTHRLHRFLDIQVLSPMKRGVIGIENLNVVLQQKLNPSPTPLCRMGRTFHVGDKVMQIRNNYQKLVFNGDVGRITAIDLSEQTVTVAFDDRSVSYDFSEIDELAAAYAVSIHKYQGSECPCVIIPVHTTHFKMLHRNLLYTGLTRGKKLVVMVGSKKALAIALHNNEVQKRFTGLLETLKENLQ
jgi:exodeoxyribonuclease V alpha subunit